MLNKKALQVFIDEFYCDGMTLIFSGWAIPPRPIARVDLLLGGQTKLRLHSFGLPSGDVAAIHGVHAQNVRFQERLPLPEDFRPIFFGQSVLIMTTMSGQSLQYDIFSQRIPMSARNRLGGVDVKLRDLRLGIGITTFNRSSILARTLDNLTKNSRFSYSLVVADDGSSDDTADMLRQKNVEFIRGENRGVAWNKNRVLFLLASIRKCDIVILLEDDTYPSQIGWESHWIIGASLYGHCNFYPPWFGAASHGGFGQWFDPGNFQGKVSGQCSAFSSEALSWVGYLDSRFGRYGFEHVEHSMRMVRGGFGGYRVGSSSSDYNYYLIKGGLEVAESVSSASDESIEHNGAVLLAVQAEGIFRPAWRTDEELALLRGELSELSVHPRTS